MFAWMIPLLQSIGSAVGTAASGIGTAIGTGLSGLGSAMGSIGGGILNILPHAGSSMVSGGGEAAAEGAVVNAGGNAVVNTGVGAGEGAGLTSLPLAQNTPWMAPNSTDLLSNTGYMQPGGGVLAAAPGTVAPPGTGTVLAPQSIAPLAKSPISSMQLAAKAPGQDPISSGIANAISRPIPSTMDRMKAAGAWAMKHKKPILGGMYAVGSLMGPSGSETGQDKKKFKHRRPSKPPSQFSPGDAPGGARERMWFHYG